MAVISTAMGQKTIRGDVFIIPNPVDRMFDEMKNEAEKYMAEYKEKRAEAWDLQSKDKEAAKTAALRAIVCLELAEYQTRERTRLITRMKRFYGDFDESDVMIEVWPCSQDHDNWKDGYWPGQVKFEETGATCEEEWQDRFPGYMPASILKGVKEGDVIPITTADGIKIELTARQLEHRYRDEGRFEEVFEYLYGRAIRYYVGEPVVYHPHLGDITVQKDL